MVGVAKMELAVSSCGNILFILFTDMFNVVTSDNLVLFLGGDTS